MPVERGSIITMQGGVLKDSLRTNDGPEPKNESVVYVSVVVSM